MSCGCFLSPALSRSYSLSLSRLRDTVDECVTDEHARWPFKHMTKKYNVNRKNLVVEHVNIVTHVCEKFACFARLSACTCAHVD